MANEHVPIEQMAMFPLFVEVANWAWNAASKWSWFARESVGLQLMKAADSVGANLVEGGGRRTLADGLHYLVIARASARETKFWIERAKDRGLVPSPVAEAQVANLTRATKMLNNLIRYRRTRGSFGVNKARGPEYDTDEDPFACDLGLEDVPLLLPFGCGFATRDQGMQYLNTQYPNTQYPNTEYPNAQDGTEPQNAC